MPEYNEYNLEASFLKRLVTIDGKWVAKKNPATSVESNLRSKWDDNISDRVKMVAIAWRVEMKLRGRFTTYPKNRKPKEMLLRYYVSLQLYCSKRVIYTSKRIKKGNWTIIWTAMCVSSIPNFWLQPLICCCCKLCTIGKLLIVFVAHDQKNCTW